MLKEESKKLKDCDALCRRFWEVYQGHFPQLSKCANIILTASPSSSIAERYFSEVSAMTGPPHNRLSAKTIFQKSVARHYEIFEQSVLEAEPDANLSLEKVRID